MITLSKQMWGANVYIGISSESEQEITEFFNGIYNFNGCPENTELDWISRDTSLRCLAIFQTNPKRFQRAIYNQNITKLTYPTKVFDGRKIKALAKEQAAKFVDEIPANNKLLTTF